MTSPAGASGGLSKSRLARDRRALIGALFKAGKRDVALALIRNEITQAEAERHLR